VELLKDPAITDFRVVTTPQKAVRDARFFHDALRSRHFSVGALYVNRVWGLKPGKAPAGSLASQVLDWYTEVRDSHLAEVQEVTAAFQKSIPAIRSLPELERDIDGIEALERIAAAL
jgi:anion-transporting  ArsA/GET3 family ATPase